MSYFADTFHLLQRHIRNTIRIPVWIFVTLTQPIIWLALYGQLFSRVVDIPGFESNSYIEYLTPGVVIMTALFGSAWAGMGLLEDLNDGVVDRMLATPVFSVACRKLSRSESQAGRAEAIGQSSVAGDDSGIILPLASTPVTDSGDCAPH